MDFLTSDFNFNMLSLADLLAARDAFHPHLMHKANVVGTAVGRYLIRKTDPFPPMKAPADSKLQARTLENSEIREYSWPCVIVFVSKWEEADKFRAGGEYEPNDFVPKTIYMPDGRRVPICVVEAPLVTIEPDAADGMSLANAEDKNLSGGYPIVTSVQGVEHVGSAGCLVSDGHTTYLLTSRHVAGAPGAMMKATIGGRPIDLGPVSDKQISILPFEKLYESWPGKYIFVNVDVALIEVPDVAAWSASIYRLGLLGPLADLSTQNLSLNVIGCPVRATGGISGPLEGRVAALFYRYKAVGGREYVADFLIGSRDDEPLATRPGDSGSIWVVDDSENDAERFKPLAIQWGGAVFGNAYERQPFALATNLSNVCRELNVEILRASHFAQFEYWGAVGHYTIGALACTQPGDPRLGEFLLANQDRISFKPSAIDKSVNDVSVPGFVQLADVPDIVWKVKASAKAKYGRQGNENPNHYADIDLEKDGQKSLDQQTPNAAALVPETWRKYYKAIGFNTTSQRGLLPFRVWQIYKKMEQFVRDKDTASYIAAAGVLAHYIGDACQPLHGSYLDDGDPFRNPDGTPSETMLGHGKGFAHGVHSAYETAMLNVHYDALIKGVQKNLGESTHGMALVSDGQHAGFATIELMRRSRKNLAPKNLVKAYGDLVETKKTGTASTVLWNKFQGETVVCVADGCRTLAMIWESAWINGGGMPGTELKAISKRTLQKIYEGQEFLPSHALGQIDAFL